MKNTATLLLSYTLLPLFFLSSCKKETQNKERTDSPSHQVTEEDLLHEDKRELKVQAVNVLCNKKQSANATQITDGFGTYLITSRHIFARSGNFSVQIPSANKQMVEKQIVAIDTEKQKELCICLLGDKETLIEPEAQSGTLGQIIETLRSGSPAQISWIEQATFSRLADHASASAIAEWTLLPERVTCLDTYPGPGSSGAGYSNPSEPELFWVIAGEWPKGHLSAMRDKSGHKDAPGFTLICGRLWTEIELTRQGLMAKQSKP